MSWFSVGASRTRKGETPKKNYVIESFSKQYEIESQNGSQKRFTLRKAIQGLKEFPDEIDSNNCKSIKGIGPVLASEISRLLQQYDSDPTQRTGPNPGPSAGPAIPVFTSVQEWLQSYPSASNKDELVYQFIHLFDKAGYDNMASCLDLSPEELQRIGITVPGHIKTLVVMSKQLNTHRSIYERGLISEIRSQTSLNEVQQQLPKPISISSSILVLTGVEGNFQLPLITKEILLRASDPKTLEEAYKWLSMPEGKPVRFHVSKHKISGKIIWHEGSQGLVSSSIELGLDENDQQRIVRTQCSCGLHGVQYGFCKHVMAGYVVLQRETAMPSPVERVLKQAGVSLIPEQRREPRTIAVPDTSVQPNRPKQRKKEYRPAFRSGGWAILVALYEASTHHDFPGWLGKAQLQQRAQIYCESSMLPASHEKMYAAWSSSSTLINNGLLTKKSSPAKYSLTPKGFDLAKQLYEESMQPSLEAPASKRSKIEADLPNSSSQSFKLPNSSSQPFKLPNSSNSVIEPSNSVLEPTILEISMTNFELPSSAETSQYELICLVDKRELHDPENNLVTALTLRGVRVESRELSLGDIMWVIRPPGEAFPEKEIVVDWIIERKTVRDFLASLKDGRYDEQKFRLRRSGITNVVYLIEGEVPNDVNSEMRLHLEQEMLKTQIHDGFLLQCTKNSFETLKYLSNIHNRLFNRRESQTLLLHENFANFSSAVSKSANSTIQDLFAKQLMILPKVSEESAKKITELYPTPHLFLTALRVFQSYNDQLNFLKNLHKKTSKKISEGAAKSILSIYSHFG